MGKQQGHLVSNLFAAYKRSANKRGSSFALTRAQFATLISSDCYICGAKPENKRVSTTGVVLLYNGIDRVNNTQGYEIENAKPCCWRCNSIKGRMDLEELKAHLKQMIKGLGVL